MRHILSLGEELSRLQIVPSSYSRLRLCPSKQILMQSMVLSRGSISSIYAVVIPVRPLFATSSHVQSTGIRSDTVIGTSLRRACGASCIRLCHFVVERIV